MAAKTIHAWPDMKSGQGGPAANDDINSGGAVTKALADNTFGVGKGGGGSEGGMARGVVDSPTAYDKPGK